MKQKVLVNIDTPIEIINSYKDAGWQIDLLSDRYINLNHQVSQKSKELGLEVVYNRRRKYDIDFSEGDPMMSFLKQNGKRYKKNQVIKSVELENGFDLSKVEEVGKELMKDVDLKFIKVQTRFSYEERPGVAPAASGSRPFCKGVLSANKMWTLEEIQAMVGIGYRGNLPVGPQAVADPFLYTGGFYTTPGGQRGPDTTPYCRHLWKLNLVMVP